MTLCVSPGSQIAVEMHRVRLEALCDICSSAEQSRWFEAVEIERFSHGMGKKAFLAKIKREGARLRAEKRAAEVLEKVKRQEKAA